MSRIAPFGLALPIRLPVAHSKISSWNAFWCGTGAEFCLVCVFPFAWCTKFAKLTGVSLFPLLGAQLAYIAVRLIECELPRFMKINQQTNVKRKSLVLNLIRQDNSVILRDEVLIWQRRSLWRVDWIVKLRIRAHFREPSLPKSNPPD